MPERFALLRFHLRHPLEAGFSRSPSICGLVPFGNLRVLLLRWRGPFPADIVWHFQFFSDIVLNGKRKSLSLSVLSIAYLFQKSSQFNKNSKNSIIFIFLSVRIHLFKTHESILFFSVRRPLGNPFFFAKTVRNQKITNVFVV